MHFYGCICSRACVVYRTHKCNAMLFDIGIQAESLLFHSFVLLLLYEAFFFIEKQTEKKCIGLLAVLLLLWFIMLSSACLRASMCEYIYYIPIKLTSACISINNVFNNNLFFPLCSPFLSLSIFLFSFRSRYDSRYFFPLCSL